MRKFNFWKKKAKKVSNSLLYQESLDFILHHPDATNADVPVNLLLYWLLPTNLNPENIMNNEISSLLLFGFMKNLNPPEFRCIVGKYYFKFLFLEFQKKLLVAYEDLRNGGKKEFNAVRLFEPDCYFFIDEDMPVILNNLNILHDENEE